LHLDLPWSPARLEQRIGRLDRMGRDSSRSVLSVVPTGSGRTERALMGLHSSSLNVFERSLGGLEHREARVVEQEEGIDSVLNSVRGKEISNWKSVADPVGRTGAANGGDGFEIVQGDPCCDVKLGSLGSFLAGLSASAGWFRPDGVGRSRVF